MTDMATDAEVDRYFGDEPNEHQEPPYFRLLRIGEIESKPPRYIVKPIIEEDTTAIWFGESEALKSFIVGDLSAHCALNLEWHGYKMSGGPVVYLAGEGHGGIKRRFNAWEFHNGHDLSAAPLHISNGPTDLLNLAAVEVLREAIMESIKAVGLPRLIVVDTLNRNMTGDENSNSDIAKLFQSLDRVRSEYGAAAILIHHMGHEAKDRPRGARALINNSDATVLIEREPNTLITRFVPQKMKDGPRPDPLQFEAHIVEVGRDEDDEPVTSLALTRMGYTEPVKPQIARMGPKQRQAVETLQTLQNEHRERLDDTGVNGTPRVLIADFRERLTSDGLLDKKRSRQAWHELFGKLKERNLIRVDGLYVSAM